MSDNRARRLLTLLLGFGVALAALAGAPAQAAQQVPAMQAITGASATTVTAGGFFSCGLKAGGAAECWGADSEGQATPPSDAFVRLAAGWDFTCGILDDGDFSDGGALACWGADSAGQTAVPAGDDYIEIAAGGEQACARHLDWTVECWGGVVDVPSASDHFYAIALGNDFGCGIKSGGALGCWGWDGLYHVVTGIPSGTYDHIAAFGTYACAISNSDRSIACWGENLNSRLAAPTGKFFDLGIGNGGGCGIQYPSSELSCWGDGPGAVSGSYLSIASGFDHYCAVGSTSKVTCWGSNGYGQSQPGLTSSALNLQTGVAANVSIPLTHVSPVPTITVTGTLPAGLSRSGLQITGTPTAHETQTVQVSSTASIIPIDQSLDIAVGWGPVASYQLTLSDNTPVEGQVVSFSVAAYDGVGNLLGDYTSSSTLTSDVSGDAKTGYGEFTFAAFDPAAQVSAPVVHTITVGSSSNSVTTAVPITVDPLVASVEIGLDPTTIAVHGTAAATLIGRDSNGTQVADLTAYSTFTSNKPADLIAGGTITVLGDTGQHQITGAYGSYSDSANLSATPGALATVVVTPSAIAAPTGDTVTLTVEGFDADSNSLGNLTGSAVISSSVPADDISGGDVTFTFDPAAGATAPVVHTLTAMVGGIGGSADVTVAPLVTSLQLHVTATSAMVGETLTVVVEGLDSGGDPVGDLSAYVTLASDQGDTISGNKVTFVHASPHTITATYGTLSRSALVEVSPRPGMLGATGADILMPLTAAGLLMLLGALAFPIARHRRAGRSETSSSGGRAP